MRPVATACADVLLSALALATLRAYRDDTIDVPERWVAALDALLAE
jgi:hypothetical protein